MDNRLADKKIIVLTGPTAIGKTDLAIDLVRELDSFIISADSRQVYKELSIGTAKPNPIEIAEGKIQLVDHVSITDYYSVGKFMYEALELIEKAHAEGKTPILCGGTGLYIKAVCEGLDVIPEVDKAIKETLNTVAETEGLAPLLTELEDKDPDYYHSVDKANHHRIIRAVSVIRQTGKGFSQFLNQPRAPRPFVPINVILEKDRQLVYDRINTRVIKMIEMGLVEEVKALLPYKDLQALQTVGYKEIFQYLEGHCSLDEAISILQMNTRRYAKRQMTWNRNQLKGEYFDPSNKKGIVNYITQQLSN